MDFIFFLSTYLRLKILSPNEYTPISMISTPKSSPKSKNLGPSQKQVELDLRLPGTVTPGGSRIAGALTNPSSESPVGSSSGTPLPVHMVNAFNNLSIAPQDESMGVVEETQEKKNKKTRVPTDLLDPVEVGNNSFRYLYNP